MSRKAVKIRPLGIITDIDPVEVPETHWTGGQNVRFNNKVVQKVRGYEPAISATLPSDIEYMYPIDSGDVYYWLYCGDQSVGVTDGSTAYDITPVAGVNASTVQGWNGGIINGIAVLNNGVDNPIFWDGNTANPMTDLTNWPASTKAQVVRPFKNYLVALNVTESGTDYENMVRTSHYADPGAIPTSWDYTDATKDAVRTILADTPGALIDCAQLRDYNILYKERATYIMEYVGGQFVFTFRLLFNDTGVMSTNCVVEYGGKHIVLTQDDVIIHDGNSYQSIIDEQMRDSLFDSINPSRKDECFLAMDQERDEVWICYPSGSSQYADKAIIWNANTGKFGTRELPGAPFINYGIGEFADNNTWATYTETWDSADRTWAGSSFRASYLVMAVSGDTTMHRLDSTNTENGTNMVSYVEKTTWPLFGSESLKLVSCIRPNIKANTGTQLTFYVGTQMDENDPIDWGSGQVFTVGTTEKIDVLRKGRYISIKIESNSDAHWESGTLSIYANPIGNY